MKPLKIILLSLVCIVCSCTEQVEREFFFSQCASIPVARASATCFTYKGKAYIFGGRTYFDHTTSVRSDFLNDCWCYDPQTDTWTQMQDLPFKARTKAVAVVVEDEVYIGLGFNGRINVDSCYLRDWWRWNMTTGEWTRLQDFPDDNTNMPVTAYRDGKIYTLFGTHSGSSRSIYEYDIQADKWSQWADDWHRKSLGGTTGQTVDGICYVGGGYFLGMLNEWYAFDLSERSFRQLKSMPNEGRVFASSCILNDHLYIFGGRYIGGTLTTEKLYNDILEYDIERNRWLHCGELPIEGREQMTVFSIGGKVYFGMGEDRDMQVKSDLYSWQ